jgi:CubicO group peptidase (beta-lactamase class C family)
VLTTPGGATYAVAQGWSIGGDASAQRLIVPEGDLTVTLVELEADDGKAAIAAAWARVRPGFDLAAAQTTEREGRDGWDGLVQIVYVTPVADKRVVVAAALRKGRTFRVWLIEGALAAFDRRGAQLGATIESLKAPGVARESFAGKAAQPFDAARRASLDAFIETAMKSTDVPGAAIAIVQGGKVVHERGFGVREAGKAAKVGPRTLFLTGSTGKSLVTLMMARAVDAGVFTWDTPLTVLLPDFALGDAKVTAALKVRHTVCACTGMPRQDLEMIFESRDFTPELRLASMKSMVPTTGFGETFQYSNLLVMAGGYAAGHALFPKLKLGPAFDKAMAREVFGPLGMKDTTYDFAVAKKADHATPHALDLNGKTRAVSLNDETWVSTVRPAGGQWSSVHDYTRVLLLELGRGKLDGKQVVSEVNLLERRKPQVKVSEQQAYGMGLLVGREADIAVIQHSGGTAGFTTDYFWLPDHDVGVVIVANVGGAGLFVDVVKRRFFELLFDAEPRADKDLAQALERERQARTELLSRIKPEIDPAWLKAFAGRWQAPGLGTIELSVSKGTIVLDAGEWRTELAEGVGQDGTRALTTTTPPFAGFDLIPVERDGRWVLIVRDSQHEYVFEKILSSGGGGR